LKVVLTYYRKPFQFSDILYGWNGSWPAFPERQIFTRKHETLDWCNPKREMVVCIILLRFSRGFTQSQFNSTINKFIYTSKNTPYNN